MIVGAPIQASPVTLALARAADSVVLVARRDRSRREDVAFAAESLRLVGAPVAGVILTERGGLRRLRRGSSSGPAGSGRAVDVSRPMAARPATVTMPTVVPAGRRTTSSRAPGGAVGERSERRGRPRPTVATQTIQPLEPDDGDSLPAR